MGKHESKEGLDHSILHTIFHLPAFQFHLFCRAKSSGPTDYKLVWEKIRGHWWFGFSPNQLDNSFGSQKHGTPVIFWRVGGRHLQTNLFLMNMVEIKYWNVYVIYRPITSHGATHINSSFISLFHGGSRRGAAGAVRLDPTPTGSWWRDFDARPFGDWRDSWNVMTHDDSMGHMFV